MINRAGKFAAAAGLGVLLVGCFSVDSVSNRGRSTPSATSPSSASSPASSPGTSPSGGQMTENPKKQGFMANLQSEFTAPQDEVGKRILKEYGAMFVARGVKAPPKVIFRDDSEVAAFQSAAGSATDSIGGIPVELQPAALAALKEAIADAQSKGLEIRPRNADSSKRSYKQTVDNWKSRVDPGLAHWVKQGRLQQPDADRIRALSAADQIPEILKLESQGMFFAQDLSKTIMYSVAPPGTSQHISMLALDVEQHANARVRAVLAAHGWFQTIPSDMPHFTYLGAKESELPSLGLKKVTSGGRDFWVPEI